jgi:hypothetical protein
MYVCMYVYNVSYVCMYVCMYIRWECVYGLDKNVMSNVLLVYKVWICMLVRQNHKIKCVYFTGYAWGDNILRERLF